MTPSTPRSAYSFRRFAVVSVVSSLFVLAGCGAPEEVMGGGEVDELGSQTADIVGGQISNGDFAVVAITAQGIPFCSGTLVAPQTIVTAGHCVQAYGPNVNYYVFFGTTVNTQQVNQFVPIAQQIAHPLWDGNPQTGYDIAIMKLSVPVSGVEPIKMNTEALTQDDVGETIRHVGFGVTSGNSSRMGTKREVTYTVRQVAGAQIESGAQGKQTCGGDSGGPALMKRNGSTEETLVGVVSFGDQYCRYFGVDTRVDVHAKWLTSMSDQWEKPAAQAPVAGAETEEPAQNPPN